MSQKVKFSDLFSFSITGQDILKLFTSQNKRGCNPLMTAAEFESNDVLQFLLHYLKGLVISKAQYFYNVKNGSSNIMSKSLSKNLSNGYKQWCFCCLQDKT